ncbi:MAG: preprotein translocase subunit YajC [Bdellovibrionales bacterium]|nr:preprotein translocase subunit YajC [Bdellovibrionales bacterium]
MMYQLSNLFINVAYAQEATPAGFVQPSFGEVMARMMPMLVMVFFVFYFLVVKPQQNKTRAQEEMVSNLKKGDEVLTAGGAIGKVLTVESDHVVLEMSPNVRVKYVKSRIEKKIEKSQVVKSAA